MDNKSEAKYKRLKYACYTSSLSMSIAGNLSPLLFLTFRSLYDISFSLLGLLVLINFVSQLIVDLLFSFFSHKFNVSRAVKMMPLLTMTGLLFFSVWPFCAFGRAAHGKSGWSARASIHYSYSGVLFIYFLFFGLTFFNSSPLTGRALVADGKLES